MSFKKSLITGILTIVSLLGYSASAHADAVTGEAAPDFVVKDSTGKEHSLKDYKGKTVVIEWFNPNCPFVKKFYSKGHMQRFQEEAAAKGVTWITISSSAAGKQGHLTADAAEDLRKELAMKSVALVLDSDGAVGKAFGAKTTPHIFIIDPKGFVAYTGAIDSAPSTSPSDIVGATNYVTTTIDALAAGRPVDPASTQPYGCSVKY